MSSLRAKRLANEEEEIRATPAPAAALAHAVPDGVVDIDVRGGADAPARARHTMQTLLEDDPRPTVNDALLLITEVVANGVVAGHADESTRIGIKIRLAEELVHVEVVTPRRRFAPAADPDDTARRLGIVGALADRWDIDENESTRVWFELARAASERRLTSVS